MVLKEKMLERVFANASSARKTAITTRVLQLILELCAKGIHVTKRDLFYTDVKLFRQHLAHDELYRTLLAGNTTMRALIGSIMSVVKPCRDEAVARTG